MSARNWAIIRKQLIATFNPIVQSKFDQSPSASDQTLMNELLIQSTDSILIAQSRISLFNQLYPQTPYALVPDAWQVKVEAKRPQLVFAFMSIDPNTGKDLTITDNELTIAHPIVSPQPTKDSIPVFTKGDFISYNVYSDNSKLIINASTADECQSVRDACVRLIDPSFAKTLVMNPIKPRQSNVSLVAVKVRIARAAYFSQGQTNMKPDWVINF